MSVTRLSLYETLGECLSSGWIQDLEKGGVQGKCMKRNESRGGRERGYPSSQPFDVFFRQNS